MMLKDLKHPMQPIGRDGTRPDGGVVRFKRNAIIDFMFKDMRVLTRPDGGMDLNRICIMQQSGMFSQEDYQQLMQLLGYSVCGYCDLSNVSEESKDEAWATQESLK